MGSRELEPGDVMIDLGAFPLPAGVADRTILAEAGADVVGIRGLVESCQVARSAGG